MNNSFSDLYLTRLPFWDKLLEDEKELLCRSASSVTFKRNESVQKGSENCVGVLLVKSGQLRVSILSEEGRDITLYRIFEGEVCILSASCVFDAITFDVFISAEEDTEVVRISADAFKKLAEDNVYVKCFGYQLTTSRFSDVMWAMQQILFMSADKRLAIFLLDEASKNNSLEIRLTHEQIAKYMASAREVVTRMLKYFAAEGIVRVERGGVKILDKDKLRALAT